MVGPPATPPTSRRRTGGRLGYALAVLAIVAAVALAVVVRLLPSKVELATPQGPTLEPNRQPVATGISTPTGAGTPSPARSTPAPRERTPPAARPTTGVHRAASTPTSSRPPRSAVPSRLPNTLGPRTPSSSSTIAAMGASHPSPARPTRTPSTSPDDTGLTSNALYGVELGVRAGHCRIQVRSPRPPLADSQLVAYLQSLLDCLGEALGPPLRAAGLDLTRPRLQAYRNETATPCGQLNASAAPAYYCSGDSTIYVPYGGDDADEAYTYARLGYLALLAHEYGHHLQYASGMFADYTTRYYAADRTERYALSRRLELQADCFTGVFLAYVGDSVALTDRDLAQLRAWHDLTGDQDGPQGRPRDHGTSQAQNYWLFRGLDSADYGRCQTWSAPNAQVR